MTEIALTKIGETATTITFGWSPIGDRGYRFSREKSAGRFSHTWDPDHNLTSGGLASATFSKDSAWYRVEALGQLAVGDWPTATPPPPPPPDRLDLSTRASTLLGMLDYLRQHPQPSVVPSGEWDYDDVLDIPAGADLMFETTLLAPQNPAASAMLISGVGTKVIFSGQCRIGKAGARNSRRSNSEAAGLWVGHKQRPTHDFQIDADDLVIEGVAQDAIFTSYGAFNGRYVGKITGRNTGADTFHHTGICHDIDYTAAELHSEGSGDDGFAVVSYKDDGARVHGIHWGFVFLRNQRDGRGISVVGGDDISVEHFDLDGTAGASIYIAAEPPDPYNTFGVNGVTMKGGIARHPNTRGIHSASVVIYPAQTDQKIENVNIVGDLDTGWPEVRKTANGPIANVAVNGRVVV